MKVKNFSVVRISALSIAVLTWGFFTATCKKSPSLEEYGKKLVEQSTPGYFVRDFIGDSISLAPDVYLFQNYKKLSDKVMGVDGSTLIRDGDPEGIQEILRSLDQKLSGGLSFSDTEVAIARKAAEEAGLTAEYARLKSAPLEQLIIAKALMIAGTESEAEKRYIAAETDNMIYTNNPTLSTQQLATMEIQAGQVQASQINAEANLLQQQRLTKQALDTALASQNTIEADRLGITMGYLDDISKLVNTEDSSGKAT